MIKITLFLVIVIFLAGCQSMEIPKTVTQTLVYQTGFDSPEKWMIQENDEFSYNV